MVAVAIGLFSSDSIMEKPSSCTNEPSKPRENAETALKMLETSSQHTWTT